jgi:ABC-type antimicrobial peptide transport system permease subunit
MISLIYVGGLYLTNINEEAIAIKNELQEFVTITSTYNDTNEDQFRKLEQEILNSTILEAFRVNTNYYRYKTMLGFRNGDRAYAFTKDEFVRFNAKMHLIPSGVEIPDNTVLLSKKQANYMKVEEGEFVSANQTDAIEVYFGEFPFQVVTYQSNAFHTYFITKDTERFAYYLVTWKDVESKDVFFQRIEELKIQYDKVEFVTYEDRIDSLKENFEINNIIYYSIIVIVSIVFAITTNAVFVGLYDKRKQEFALYQAIGIPKKRIYMKVTFEILYMNGIGIFVGAGLSMLVVSLLNGWVYHKDGLSMWYYHPTAFLATLLCDLAILIPGIELRIRRISKDIKELNFL